MAVIAQDLGTDIHFAELSISAYLIGFALGQLSGGPLSDRFWPPSFGDDWPQYFCCQQFLITQTDTLNELLSLRVFQALGGGLAVVNSAAIVRDLFRGLMSHAPCR